MATNMAPDGKRWRARCETCRWDSGWLRGYGKTTAYASARKWASYHEQHPSSRPYLETRKHVVKVEKEDALPAEIAASRARGEMHPDDPEWDA